MKTTPRCVCERTAISACLTLAFLGSACGQQTTPLYDTFNQFCLAHFGAEEESLVYETFGEQLAIVETGSWRHVSEASACLCWETNLPAKTYVEYGPTTKYGTQTATPSPPAARRPTTNHRPWCCRATR